LISLRFNQACKSTTACRLTLNAADYATSVSPNLTFEIDDIEDEWTYSKPFDYIHSRFMTSCVADWTEFLTKCFKYTSHMSYLACL
jgi:hypothetical protein